MVDINLVIIGIFLLALAVSVAITCVYVHLRDMINALPPEPEGYAERRIRARQLAAGQRAANRQSVSITITAIADSHPASSMLDRYGILLLAPAEPSECAICLNEILCGGVVAKTDCGHRFHWADNETCGGLQRWLRQHPTCPLCRKNLCVAATAAATISIPDQVWAGDNGTYV